MTGSILSGTDLSQRCPRCGNSLRSGTLACPNCSSNFPEEPTRGHSLIALANVEKTAPPRQDCDAAALGSRWGPTANTALSLFVFLSVFGASALFEWSKLDGESRQVVHRAGPGLVADSAIHNGQQPSATKVYQIAAAPKHADLDAALARARACDIEESWNCVRNSASDALALDGGNIEARTLLERSIAPVARKNHTLRAPTSTPPQHHG
jgi:hypothetical protein